MSPASALPAQPEDVVRLAARAHERDRYLAALLSPRAARPDLLALAAFAGEVGRIPLYVSEPMMGRIRLQWWRERIESGTSGGHPVATAIIAAANRHQLPAALLIGLIDAHEDSLDDRPFADETALIAYVDRIDVSLCEAAATICGLPAAPQLARNAGRAYGLARIGLETPAARAHGRLLLPSAEPVSTFEPAQLVPMVQALTASARQHLAASIAALGQLSRDARSPFLTVALVEPYLRALERYVTHPGATLDVDPFTRVWRVLRCRWTGRVN